jgi:hypothetical protein
MGPKAAMHALFNDDPFGMMQVEKFSDWKCPAKTEPTELLKFKMQVEACFRARAESKYQPYLWFEHISKAGGSSFCSRARKEMKDEITLDCFRGGEVQTDDCVSSSNCNFNLPHNHNESWESNTHAVLRTMMQHKPEWAMAENEFSWFPAQLMYIEEVPMVLMTNLRLPADWVVSWIQSFSRDTLKDKDYKNFSRMMLMPPSGKHGTNGEIDGDVQFYLPQREGNYQTANFGGKRPVCPIG